MPMKPAKDRPLDLDDLPSWTDNPEGVDEGALQTHRNLTGVKVAMDRRHPDGWGDDDLRAYIVESRKARIAITLLGVERERERNGQHEVRVDEIVAKYLQQFDNPTPNDLVGLHEMARIQLTLELLDRKLEGMTTAEKVNATDYKTIAQVRKDSLKTFQDLEKMLGIDRLSRTEESDVVVIVDRVKRQARELIKKRGRRIVCQHCEADGKVINLGLVLFHMDANHTPWRFEAECPVCHNFITISAGFGNYGT